VHAGHGAYSQLTSTADPCTVHTDWIIVNYDCFETPAKYYMVHVYRAVRCKGPCFCVTHGEEMSDEP